MVENRALFARSFCLGRGLEIGALHHPFPLPPGSTVRYVDRLPLAGLRLEYPELAGEAMVEPDVVDDGETLATLPDGSEDFVIAAQFIEHCENPIRALVNMLRVIRTGGFVLLTVPDRRRTFDHRRPNTTFDHLLAECRQGPAANTLNHYREWAELVHGMEGEAAIDGEARALMARGYSIHFHAWDSDAFLRFLLDLKAAFSLPFEIFSTLQNRDELIVALRKSEA